MCINCLKIKLEAIAEYEKEVSAERDTITCECCVSYHNFLLGVNNDLKVLCLTKIKRNQQVCPNGFRKLVAFEGAVKQRIKNKLNKVLELIDEQKEDMKEHNYLNKMNDLKALNDFVGDIEEADHN